MISHWQVLTWLNRYDPSLLPANISLDIEGLRNYDGPERIFRSRLNQLISYARAVSNPVERAEVLLNCAVLCLSKNFLQEAVLLLEDARSIYDRVDTHRLAIVETLLFHLFNSQGKHSNALLWAHNARTNYWKMVKFANQQKDASSETWYKERIYELTAELFQLPRYVYESIFDLQGSRLRVPARTYKDRIEDLLKDQIFFDASQKLPKMIAMVQRSSKDEKAEALVYAGLVSAEIGDREIAIRYLKQALALYQPASHEYLMARWILALVMSLETELFVGSINHMEECIRISATLKEKADHQNSLVPYDWYTITGEAMRRVLKRTVAAYA